MTDEALSLQCSAPYAGKVIISAPTIKGTPYLAAAATALRGSQYEARVHFTVDGENKVVSTLESLIRDVPSSRRVYGTGVSACSPLNYFDDVALAAKNVRQKVIGMVYAWTIDDTDSIAKYFERGATAIMTNAPRRVRDVMTGKDLTLATTQTAIPAATSANVVKQ